MVREVSGEGRVASQPGSQPSASAAGASSPVGADPSRVSDILDRAADLVTPEGAWTQGAYAMNSDGDCAADDGARWPNNPTCFCTLGAIQWAMGTPRAGGIISAAFVDALGFTGGYQIADWNDGADRTQPEVVAKLREAAALAREQGK